MMPNKSAEELAMRTRNELRKALAEGKALLNPDADADGWLIDRLEKPATDEETAEDAARLADVLETRREYIFALRIRNARYFFAKLTGLDKTAETAKVGEGS